MFKEPHLTAASQTIRVNFAAAEKAKELRKASLDAFYESIKPPDEGEGGEGEGGGGEEIIEGKTKSSW
jgi:hypothetical protein